MNAIKNANELPTDLKIMLVEGQTLVDHTKKAVKERGAGMDLTCKFQLRDDCRCVEKYIKRIYSGKGKSEDARELELAIIRLQTTADGILQS